MGPDVVGAREASESFGPSLDQGDVVILGHRVLQVVLVVSRLHVVVVLEMGLLVLLAGG